MKFKKIIIILAVAGLGLAVFIWLNKSFVNKTKNDQPAEKIETTYTKKFEVTEGSTYGILMNEAGIATTTRQQIFDAAADLYDLSNVRTGRSISLIYDKQTNELQQFIYPIDTEEELYITLQVSTTATTTEPVWLAERKVIPYEIKIKTAQGLIETSMYEAALAQGIDERAVIGFADAFQWTIDFAWEVQKGDTFKFIYEQRYRDGQYVMPGKVLAGKFVNSGQALYAFYYKESDTNEGYFDQDGNSAERVFLKAPLAFRYISSGFTTGLRYIAAFDIATGHRAIDYAAAYGTPIRAVGDGTVVFAGWNGAYGRMVKIRHNSTYQTNYGHMSKIAVTYGQQVTQGQTIGYVGSTGLSTGPHLHYEMVKNGAKINPFKEVFPPSAGIQEENKSAYLAAIKDWKEQLDQ
ncbi:MAG: peptidoglycan DD-metalloendopeptidase family protein [Patescibacteria group bacterium]|jgi:murein DD-endopeptidase MepM/ murein hydrolase activator NlpD